MRGTHLMHCACVSSSAVGSKTETFAEAGTVPVMFLHVAAQVGDAVKLSTVSKPSGLPGTRTLHQRAKQVDGCGHTCAYKLVNG